MRRQIASDFFGAAPAKTIVPAAGAATSVPAGAARASPVKNSSRCVSGEVWSPNVSRGTADDGSTGEREGTLTGFSAPGRGRGSAASRRRKDSATRTRLARLATSASASEGLAGGSAFGGEGK